MSEIDVIYAKLHERKRKLLRILQKLKNEKKGEHNYKSYSAINKKIYAIKDEMRVIDSKISKFCVNNSPRSRKDCTDENNDGLIK